MKSYLNRRFVKRDIRKLDRLPSAFDVKYSDDFSEAKKDIDKKKVFLKKLEELFCNSLIEIKNKDNFLLNKNGTREYHLNNDEEKTLVKQEDVVLKREHSDFDFLKGYKPSIEFICKLHHYLLLKYEKYNKYVFEYRFGKIKIHQKFINYFKLRYNNSTQHNNQYIDYNFIEKIDSPIFIDVLFIQRNELFFKVTLLDSILQFKEYFGDLKYEIDFEVKSDAENLERGHIIYDCIISISNQNEQKAQIGVEFDEISHGKVNEKDKVKFAVSKVNLVDYFYMREYNKDKKDYKTVVINKLDEYYEFFRDVNKSIFDISVALLNDTKTLMLHLISDYYINFYRNKIIDKDMSFSRNIQNDFENNEIDSEETLWEIIDNRMNTYERLFKLKKKPNLASFARLLKKDPEEILDNFNDFELDFIEECVCKKDKVCICEWNIKGNIHDLFNNYSDNMNAGNFERLRSLKDDVIELINKSSEEIIKIMQKIIFEKQKYIPIQVAFYSNYYDPESYKKILRIKVADIMKEKNISEKTIKDIIEKLDDARINNLIFNQ